MTMSMILSFILLTCISSSKNVGNPVKMSMLLLIFSGVIFISMYLSSSQIWYPFLFFLIFMGGILMMFMILSSTLPNEKCMKNKNLMIIFMMTMSLIFFPNMKTVQESVTKSVKSILDSSSSFSFLIILMLMYFFISIMMVSKEESPMRMSLC